MSIKIKGYNAISIRVPQKYIHYTHTEITQKVISWNIDERDNKKVKFVD